MSSEKRLFLFLALTFASILGIQYLMDVTGLNPPPPRKPRNVVEIKKEESPTGAPSDEEKGKAKAGEAVAGKDASQPAADPNTDANTAPKKKVELARFDELVLGSDDDHTPRGYRLAVRLDQKGAGVASVTSSRYEAEFVEGRQQRHRPLEILRDDPLAPPSLAVTLPRLARPGERVASEEEGTETDKDKNQDQDREKARGEADALAAADAIASRGEIPLDLVVWEVVRDAQGRASRPIPAGARNEAEATGRELAFRTTVGTPEVAITKTYRLFKGADGFEVELRFESPVEERTLVYKLLGPHGIPIEGEWYTGTFRDVFFGQIEGNDVTIVTKAAADIVKKSEPFQTLPIKFAGVENQYFAAFVEPSPLPRSPEDRWDSEARATVVHQDPQAPQKADVAVEITSKPFKVGPNVPVVHTYKIFTGPKTAEALAPYGATKLASYRKNQWFGIPFAGWMATTVITPMLDFMYNATAWVAQRFGGHAGNYGVAIILLTLTVRLFMFPIGRKQAMAAKKMQDLQPLLKEIQEKYKDDKEQQTRETWALYKRYKVNPLGGCLPALIQLPIFVGLWQALNNSVHLRHASFLYIENLAAPDMLFHMPFELPLVGHYFNLLPFLVVALMLVQTKLFSPPATTPEMEQQQKMMKYMMVFMAFMFYKVPSGLGIYFITSSLWQISERLLLPKAKSPALTAGDGGPGGGGPGGGGGGGKKGGGNGNGTPAKPPGKIAQFWGRVLDEASKNPTYRNLTNETERERDRDNDRRKPRERPGRRR